MGHRARPLVLSAQMLTHHERCSSLQRASSSSVCVWGGVVSQNPSLASLLLPRAQLQATGRPAARRRGGGGKGGQRDSQAASGGTHLKFATVQQQHDSPSISPPPPHPHHFSPSGDATLSGSASALLSLLCRCVSKSAAPCVISHHPFAPRGALRSAVPWQPF